MNAMIDIVEKVKEIAPDIRFKDAEHMLFFGENVINTGSERDTYRKAFFLYAWHNAADKNEH